MMRRLAQGVAAERIRVNAIAARRQWLPTLIPCGRIGEPEDIARPAVRLASDASDDVVGTSLFVDGETRLYPG
jgi:glucose 1-dehydrogenase